MSGFSSSLTFTGVCADDYSYHEGSAVLTITNNNATDITIGEVGIVYQGSNTAALLERTVLDSPITIPAGGVSQITYTIRMNYPTA